MKKIWKYFILFALLGALMCTAAFAEEVEAPTFTDVADGATFTLDASGEKFEVSYTGATSGQYLILMVAKDTAGEYTINDESIMYVNQDAAGESGVAFTVYPTKMVSAKIMLGGGSGSPVTLGYLEMPVPDVTVNVVGSGNKAETTVNGTTLNVQYDQACVVVYTTDGGETYQTLEATPNANGGYDYDLSALPSGAEVSVAVKGDANGDGKVNNTDYAIIKKMLLNDTAMTGWQAVMFDVNGDGKINNTDYAILKKHLLDTSKNLVNW